MLNRRAVMFGLPLVAAGCGAASVWAPDDLVATARYRHPGPPQITLYTCLNSGTRNGAHTGLLINASERILFDPAGSFRTPDMVERNDVIFGATDAVEAAYARFQATGGFHLIKLSKLVAPEVAELALQRALVAGPVAKSRCTRAAATLLQALPGFEALRPSWFPENLMRQFARLPGVQAEFVYQDEDGGRDAAYAGYADDILPLLSSAGPAL